MVGPDYLNSPNSVIKLQNIERNERRLENGGVYTMFMDWERIVLRCLVSQWAFFFFFFDKIIVKFLEKYKGL